MGQPLTLRTELAETPASGDFLHVIDVSDTTDSPDGTSKKVQAQYLTISDASTTVKGKVELATDAETITGTDTVRAVTPANITAKIDTDGTLAGNLDTRIPSQKAVKTYVDTSISTQTSKTYINPVIKQWDGWQSVTDSWTYASATTINVPSGAASLYVKGDKLKLTQSSIVKYFYVVSVADTVLTIIGGTSYTFTNSAVSDIYVSHQNTPIGFPQSMNYTPTITSGGGTPTTVTATCKFSISGDQCKIYEVVTITNAGTASGEVLSTLPVSFADDRSPLSAWEGASTGYVCVAHGLIADLTKIGISKYDFTTIWATGRVLFIAGTYSF